MHTNPAPPSAFGHQVLHQEPSLQFGRAPASPVRARSPSCRPPLPPPRAGPLPLSAALPGRSRSLCSILHGSILTKAASQRSCTPQVPTSFRTRTASAASPVSFQAVGSHRRWLNSPYSRAGAFSGKHRNPPLPRRADGRVHNASSKIT